MLSEQIKEEIRKVCEVLKAGGIVLYPTDTVWGIGCDATNKDAVEKIYQLKRRSDSKAMLVLLDDMGKVASYADVPEIAYDLVESADKPMTIIYPGASRLAENLINEDKTIGIRITQEEFTKQLIHRFHKPIVSTSANISGEPTAAIFDEISEEIINGVDYVVQYRQDDKRRFEPSSIIKLGMDGEFQLIRK